MMPFLYSIDTAIFFFFNRTISNPVTDLLWPLITDYSSFLAVRVVLLAVWLFLIIREEEEAGRPPCCVSSFLWPVIS